MEVEKTMKAYPNLSRPIKIGNVTIKNRMFMAPMDTGFGNNSYGGLTQAGVEYFVRRAEGGFGLIFSGGTSPDNKVDVSESILNHEKEFVQIGRALNERLRAFGTKMFTQLSMNIGRNAGMKSPSVLPVLGNPSIKTQALTIEEIKTKISEIGKAAKLCKEAGYAGVEIHALHWGHLIDSFALAFMNHRTDEYGGNLENRLRVVKEIREAIASECGKEYPVSIRFAVRSFMKDFDKASFDRKDEVGRTLEEAIEIAKLLEEYGYDALSTDAGTLDAFYYAMPPSYVEMGYTLEYVKEIKKVVNIPVFAGSRMADPDLAEKAISDGIIDAAVIGRQAIADPDFAKKIIAGKPGTVRTCIGCNQGCIWGYFTKGCVSCAVNPEVGHESSYRLTKAPEKKKVVIVGGGVAGMEAARISTLRGHEVTLYEKSDKLGGNLIPAGNHDFKAEVASLNNYFKNEMKRLKIDVKLNCELSVEQLKKSGADAIILATGSVPVMPKTIKGIDHPKTISGVEACMQTKPIGEKVVVVGGGLVGCEIAFGFEKEGKEVTIVEALDDILKVNDVPAMNKVMLKDAFEYYDTNILTSTKLKAVTDAGAIVELPNGTEKTIEADTVVISVGYRSVPSMASELAGCGAEIYEIGDGNRVGNVLTSIQDAFEVTHNL